jgi:hypothetical protein
MCMPLLMPNRQVQNNQPPRQTRPSNTRGAPEELCAVVVVREHQDGKSLLFF